MVGDVVPGDMGHKPQALSFSSAHLFLMVCR